MNKLFTPKGIEEHIIAAAARAIWCSAYIDAAQNGELPKRSRKAGPGEDWDQVAPPTPVRALMQAAVLMDHVLTNARQSAGVRNKPHIQCLWQVFAEAIGLNDYFAAVKEVELSESFGHYIAMQAMGHGVSWADDHEPLPFAVPSVPGDISYHDLIN